MYLWEIAAVLGKHHVKEDEEQTPPEPRTARDLLRARVAHARGEGPKPEAKPLDPNSLNSITRAMS